MEQYQESMKDNKTYLFVDEGNGFKPIAQIEYNEPIELENAVSAQWNGKISEDGAFIMDKVIHLPLIK